MLPFFGNKSLHLLKQIGLVESLIGHTLFTFLLDTRTLFILFQNAEIRASHFMEDALAA